jgi:hypothetical protein
MQRTAIAMACLMTALGAGCAKKPESIAAAYVSEMPYMNYTCPQLGEKEARLSKAYATAAKQQEAARRNDTVMVVLIGLPVASLSGDNIAPEIARLKGEQEAVQKAKLRQGC